MLSCSIFPFTPWEISALVSCRPFFDGVIQPLIAVSAGWMIFWNNEKFWVSQILVTINSLAQLYAVSQLPPIAEGNLLTHWVAKTTAGIGILDFVDNGAVALVSLANASTEKFYRMLIFTVALRGSAFHGGKGLHRTVLRICGMNEK